MTDTHKQQNSARDTASAPESGSVQISKAEYDALIKDKARLDYLNECNRRLNECYGTKYSWKLVQSHNVNRLMFKNLHPVSGGVDLHDSHWKGFEDCRKAIDEVMPQNEKE